MHGVSNLKTLRSFLENFLLIRIAMSSAYSSVEQRFLLSTLMSLSTTRLHNRTDSMPPCRESLNTKPSRFSSASTAIIFLLPSMGQIHRKVVSPSPCRLATFVITSNEVLQKASSKFRNAPNVTSPFSAGSSICVITQSSAVSVVRMLQWLSL